jgi:hypothetical protein
LLRRKLRWVQKHETAQYLIEYRFENARDQAIRSPYLQSQDRQADRQNEPAVWDGSQQVDACRDGADVASPFACSFSAAEGADYW